MRKRQQAILVRLTEREKAHLKNEAEKAGISMEVLVRKLVLALEVKPRPPDNIDKLLHEINAIGNNINQIARKVNSENRVTQTQLEEVLRLLGEIYRQVKG